jgi:uncharacterized delta-60 repeat protein
VIWLQNYDYTVSAANYVILGNQHATVQTDITLDPSDATYDRIDAVVADTNDMIVVITGTPSANPLQPSYDPATQIPLAFINVQAGTTSPACAVLYTVYREDASTPTEWDTVSSSGTIVVNSTNNPRTDTICIEGTAAALGSTITFTPLMSFSSTNITQLDLYIRSKGSWGTTANGHRLTVTLYDGATQLGLPVNIPPRGAYGFDSSTTGSYQQIVLSRSLFNISSGLDITSMVFTITGTDGSMGFYIDDISIETNCNQIPLSSSFSQRFGVENEDDLATEERSFDGDGFGIEFTNLSKFDVAADDVYIRDLDELPFVTTTGEDDIFNDALGTGPDTDVLEMFIGQYGANANQIIIGGSFLTFDGVQSGRIARLSKAGVLDTAFSANIGSGADHKVVAMVELLDGSILVGGEFPSWNGVTVNNIICLNDDGTLNTAFNTNLGTGGNLRIQDLWLDPVNTGKIYVAGYFSVFNGVARGRLLRLNSDGTEDTAFTTSIGTGFNGIVNKIHPLSDGTITIAGEYTSFNGTSAQQASRLNADGTLDATFQANVGTGTIGGSTFIEHGVVQADGKTIYGGTFTFWNGTPVSRMVRLNVDGSLDTAFMTNIGTGFNGTPTETVLDSDQRILVPGGFTTFNGLPAGRLIRLNSDGTADEAFNSGTIGDGFTRSLNKVLYDGDTTIYIGSAALYFNGVSRPYFMRLDIDTNLITSVVYDEAQEKVLFERFDITQPISPDFFSKDLFLTFNRVHSGEDLYGITLEDITKWSVDAEQIYYPTLPDAHPAYELDTNFNTNLGTGFNTYSYGIRVRQLAVQTDGKIVAIGIFDTFNGNARSRVVRLNADGTEDSAFQANIGTAAFGDVWAVAIQADGKILIGGAFATWNGVGLGAASYLVRLNTDGTRDTTFSTNLGTGLVGNFILSLAVQPSDQKILVGGSFDSFNGSTANCLTRLNTDGTPDTTFNTNLGTGSNSTSVGHVWRITIQSDDKILLGGAFVQWDGVFAMRMVRLNTDGTRDTSTISQDGFHGAGFDIYDIQEQTDGKLVVVGAFGRWDDPTVNGIIRLNSDFSKDHKFLSTSGGGLSGAAVTGLKGTILPDGSIIAGGLFTTYNDFAVAKTVNRIVKIGPSGTFDSKFGLGFDARVDDIVLLPNGNLLIAGAFTTFNGSSVAPGLVQLKYSDALSFMYSDPSTGRVSRSNDIEHIPTFKQGFKMTPITAAEASLIPPEDTLVIFVSDTNGTFTSAGFWGYQNGAWHAF